MSRPKALVIGLDGVSWDLLDPLIEKGIAPFIGSLRETGCLGRLRSTDPPSTAPAWATFMTGKNPGKHGIFDLMLLDGHTLDEIPVTTSRLVGHRIWDILSAAGKDSIIINMPVTWPPSPLRGILLSDFLTPKSEKTISWPPEIQDEIEKRFGPFRLYFNNVYTRRNIAAVIDEARRNLEYRFDTATYLLENKPWDFAFVHCFGTDRIQHELFHLIDPSHPLHRKKETARHLPGFEEYFAAVDRCCRDLSRTAGRDTPLIIMSDHGMGPVHRFLVFNNWLKSEGYLVLKRTLPVALKRLLFAAGLTPGACYRATSLAGFSNLRQSTGIGTRYRLLNTLGRLFLSLENADWTRTRAYSKGNYGQIYINLEGRQPHGIVKPGDEYNKLREEIAGKLRNLVDPRTGERIELRVRFREEIYEGSFLYQAPDIYVLPEDNTYKALGTMDFLTRGFAPRNFAQSGDHRMDGIIAAAGPPFRKKFRVDNAAIEDLAPTLLHLLGVPIPSDMDGSSLRGMMTPRFLEENPPGKCRPTGEIQPEKPWVSDADADEIRKRLTGMGYIG